jgi:cell division septal protein FtsQ
VAAEVDEGWGPHARGRARRRIRPLRWLVIVLVLLLLVVAAILLWVSSRIPTIEVDGLASTSRPMHVLVVGATAVRS